MTSWARKPPSKFRPKTKISQTIGPPPSYPKHLIAPKNKLAAAKQGFVPDGHGGMMKSLRKPNQKTKTRTPKQTPLTGHIPKSRNANLGVRTYVKATRKTKKFSPKMGTGPGTSQPMSNIMGYTDSGPIYFNQNAANVKQLKKQQQISNQYGITTYHDDGSVATIPKGQGVGLQGDMVLPDGAPYNPNVMYEFHGDGSYTVHPKPGGA